MCLMETTVKITRLTITTTPQRFLLNDSWFRVGEIFCRRSKFILIFQKMFYSSQWTVHYIVRFCIFLWMRFLLKKVALERTGYKDKIGIKKFKAKRDDKIFSLFASFTYNIDYQTSGTNKKTKFYLWKLHGPINKS